MLERGTFEELEAVVGAEVGYSDIDPLRVRPFVEADEFSHTFSAQGFAFRSVMRAFAPHMGHVASAVGADGAGDFSLQVASILLEKNRVDRAALLLVNSCGPHGRSQWLQENQGHMLDACALVSAEKVYASLRSDRWRSVPALQVASCVRLAFLDASETSLGNLMKMAEKVEYPLDLRLEAASYAFLLDPYGTFAHDLPSLFAAQASSMRREAKKLDDAYSILWRFWSSRSSAGTSMTEGDAFSFEGRLAPLAAACFVRWWKMVASEETSSDGFLADDGTSCEAFWEELWRASCRLLSKPCKGFAQRASLALLRREMASLCESTQHLELPQAESLGDCLMFEDELEVQKGAYARSKAPLLGEAASVIGTQRVLCASKHAASSVPALYVRLFGHFEVSIGGMIIDDQDFHRQKLRTLLAILVLEAGHDLSCGNLGERMWPDSTPSAARHNLYNLVSILRRGLSLADGTCPYLYRPHGIVRLEKENLDSDVARLGEVCRNLRCDDLDHVAYARLLEQVQDVYRGDFLPTEQEEPMILAARAEWKSKLVNSLQHAARRLVAMGDSHTALNMVQIALSCDPQREDCYEQLMTMQARCGQRPAAIETWLRYRTYLKDELGIDPSPRASQIYERIISGTI